MRVKSKTLPTTLDASPSSLCRWAHTQSDACGYRRRAACLANAGVIASSIGARSQRHPFDKVRAVGVCLLMIMIFRIGTASGSDDVRDIALDIPRAPLRSRFRLI